MSATAPVHVPLAPIAVHAAEKNTRIDTLVWATVAGITMDASSTPATPPIRTVAVICGVPVAGVDTTTLAMPWKLEPTFAMPAGIVSFETTVSVTEFATVTGVTVDAVSGG
jgi:hypothetical protein